MMHFVLKALYDKKINSKRVRGKLKPGQKSESNEDYGGRGRNYPSIWKIRIFNG
jgi:hypothetical protein